MAVSIKDALKDLTPEGLFEDFREVATALGISTTALQRGEPIRGFISVFCRWLVAPWNAQVTPALRALFLEHATGDWLTLAAWVLYGVRRKRETFGTQDLIVENREGGFYTINPGDIRWANAAGKTFKNTSSGVLPVYGGTGDYPTLELTFVADEAGSGSDTDIGEVPEFPDVPLLVPGSGVYLRTNTAAIYGQDLEEEEDLKERCRLSTGPLSPAGPRAAYEYVALSTRVPDGTEPERLLFSEETDVATSVNRCLVVNNGGGSLSVYLADPDGPAAGDTATLGSDVYLVNQAIQFLVVPAGITATVAAAPAQALAIGLELYLLRDSNVTEEEAEEAASAAVVAFFKRFPIGGRKKPSSALRYVVMEEIRAIAKCAVPGTFNVISDPVDDVVIPATAVVQPTITVTATVVTQ
jgi:hypothetical protein